MIELVNKKSNVNFSTPTIITGGGTADLSNYYTKEEVDALIPDIMPLSSIGEVSGPSVKGIWTIKIDIAQFFGQYAHYNYYSDHLYANLIVKYNDEIKLYAMNYADQSYDMKILCKGNVVTLSCLDVLRTFTLESDGNISLTTYKFARDTDVLAKNNITEYIPSHDYNPATKKYVDNAVDNIDLSGYALKSEIPDTTGLATETYVDGAIAAIPKTDLSEYAKLEDIPDTSGFALKSEIPDTSNLALKSEIPDTSAFITAADLPDTSGFTTEEEVNALINTALGVIENGTY